MAASEYYDHSSFPSTGAFGSSSAMRAELARIETGISAKLPDLSGNGGEIVAVNAGATALEAITTTGTGSGVRATSPTLSGPTISGGVSLVNAGTGAFNATVRHLGTMTAGRILTIDLNDSNRTIDLGGTLDTANSFTTSGNFALTLVATGVTNVTLPTTGTLATLAGAETLSNKTLTTPDIGVATGTSLAVTGALTSSGTGGIGYVVGAGGSVVQATDKSTAVTLDKITGNVITNNAALAAATIVSFTLNNSTIAAADMIMCTHNSGGTIGAYTLNGRATGAGTAQITIRNNTGGSLSESLGIKFVVIKAVVS